MPTGAIQHPDDPLARMAGGDLVEEALHALAIDAGQNQGIQLTVGHRDRLGVRVFLHDHGLTQGPNGLGAPTAPGIRDVPEACPKRASS